MALVDALRTNNEVYTQTHQKDMLLNEEFSKLREKLIESSLKGKTEVRINLRGKYPTIADCFGELEKWCKFEGLGLAVDTTDESSCIISWR